MALPGYQDFMLPVLELASDGKEYHIREAMEILADRMNLAEDDLDRMLPSGTQTQFYNRVTWAITYLAKSLLLEKSGRGRFRIAPRGTEVLRKKPSTIDNRFLEKFPEYLAFKNKKNNKLDSAEIDASSDDNESTPHERLDAAYKELKNSLADDLLERVRGVSDKFFEHLVVDVLIAMGYGGSRAERGQVVGKSGDGGVDGIIQEDRLGLDLVYIQAKQWNNNVGPDEIRKFVGSLGERRAQKGVFITCGAFTSGAVRAAELANARIVLIDGDKLAQFMIDYGVGVSEQKIYSVRRIDGDYFEEG